MVGHGSAFLAPLAASVNHDTVAAGMSSGTLSGTYSGKPFDTGRYRAVFPDRWSAFLRAHFRDARHVAYAFSVDDKTARNWLAGITAPRAEIALTAVSAYPSALPRLMGAA